MISGIPTTMTAIVTAVPPDQLAVAVGGTIFEATDPTGLGPSVGNSVLVDYLPSTGQWMVVAVVP